MASDTRTAWERLRDGDGTPEEVAAARVLGALDERGALNDDGRASLAAAVARANPPSDAPEWELQEMLEELREYAECPDGLTTWLSRTQAAALLALLEAEDCKRRIEAAGWRWDTGCPHPNTTSLFMRPGDFGVDIEFGQIAEPATPADWTAAAEYAEAHAQGVPK